MDILFVLIPLSVGIVFALIAVFAWALQQGQFDDLEREGERILDEDGMRAVAPPAGISPGVDADQTPR